MEPHHLKKIDIHVALWGVVLSLSAVFFRDYQIIFGTLLGSLLAIVNWLGFRVITQRFITGAKRGRLAILLVVKTGLMFGAVGVVVFFQPVNIIAFIIGLSSLILGITTHSVRQVSPEGKTVF